MDSRKKREQEKRLVGEMIALYCKKQHHIRRGLCPECAALRDYALERIGRCPFMETKTFCSRCTVHCYKPEQRVQIKAVMRFAGPRLIFSHPLLVVHHGIETLKSKKERNAV